MSSVAVRSAQQANSGDWEDFEYRLPSAVEPHPWSEVVDEEALVACNPVVAAIGSRTRRSFLRANVDLLHGYVDDDSAPELTLAAGRAISEADDAE